ncbi:MAG TPA: carboxypeptidase regulatory-like domain-containing protein [Elusimicrobiota bacterium]|nr:carboxypeptidase regulatory-like domain-containing protein [Elusimicrobiota bacterium]
MEPIHGRHTSRSRAGTTITELMVAMVILSIGVLGMFGAFRYIGTSIHVSRAKTLATNLGQERIESLKNLTYYGLLVATTTATDNTVNPAVLYDNGEYSPETIVTGGMTFTRYTLVEMVQVVNDVVSSVSLTYPDTGMKKITVTVVWSDAGVRKSWTLSNLLENPNVGPLDSSISGNAQSAVGFTNLAGVNVSVDQYPDYTAITAADGSYSFRVHHGTYTVSMSTPGYYDWTSSVVNAPQGSGATVTSAMVAIASGSIAGSAWYNPGLVISEVVGTTTTVAVKPSGTGSNSYDVEYVELFNPTTYQISLANTTGSGSSAGEHYKLNTYVGGTQYSDLMNNAASTVFVSSYVKSGGYYLIADAQAFFVNGQWVTSNAYYNQTDAISDTSWGGIQLTDTANNTVDQVCWNGSGGPPAHYCNGSYIPTDGTHGLEDSSGNKVGNQLVRFSSPTALGRGTYGSAYNAQNNATDFQYPVYGSPSTLGFNFTPFVSTSPALPIISGVPAVGAYVAASDSNSGSTQTYTAYVSASVGNQLYAPFKLVGVATGSWTVDIALNSYYAQLTGVVMMTQGSVVGIPNAATVPSWTAAAPYEVELSSTSYNGFIKGTVENTTGGPIPGISVTCAGVTKTTDSNGLFFMAVTSGAAVIRYNPNNANTLYVEQDVPVTVNAGQLLTEDTVLSQGGTLTGYVSIGSTPIPNFTVTANLNGNQMGAAVTNSAGVFTIRGLSTGTYVVEPVVDTGQDTSPLTISATVLVSQTVNIGTFTVSGAYGSITGWVKNNSALVTTGAMILASTGTIPSTLPAIYGSSAAAQSPVYAVSSLADGTYTLPVRGSNTYNLKVFVPTLSGTSAVTTAIKSYSGIAVSPGAATTQNLTLP